MDPDGGADEAARHGRAEHRAVLLSPDAPPGPGRVREEERVAAAVAFDLQVEARRPREPAQRDDLGPRVLLRSDLLIRDDPIEFFHPVVRSALYEDLDAVARSAGHRRAAELRLESCEPHEQAAAHLMLVNRGADPFVVETLRTAAQRSASFASY